MPVGAGTATPPPSDLEAPLPRPSSPQKWIFIVTLTPDTLVWSAAVRAATAAALAVRSGAFLEHLLQCEEVSPK